MSKAIEEAPSAKDGDQQGNSSLQPSSIEEKKLGSMNEKLDTRFTGKDAEIRKNKADANPRTQIDQATPVPGIVEENAGQPIPLEYRDQLIGN